MGGRTTMVAKPWLHEIHIHPAHSPHPVLAHELAHVVAAPFGAPPLQLSARHGLLVNMGLVEGLAEGDRVIVRGQHRLKDGQKVEIVDAAKL